MYVLRQGEGGYPFSRLFKIIGSFEAAAEKPASQYAEEGKRLELKTVKPPMINYE